VAGLPLIVSAESVTALHDVAGKVLVAGSHGGRVAASYAASAGVRAVILNDAGIGKDEAGVAGLAWLATIGMAAAAVSHASARIGDGADMLARGIISRANAPARQAGVVPGMPCRDAAVLLLASAMPVRKLPPYSEGRYELAQGTWGLDSIGMVLGEDAGRMLVIGSHCALHGGRPESALPVPAGFAAFNDAGGAVSRLPVLAARGIAAVAVGCMSARIGDARSMWETGVVSAANREATKLGVGEGMGLREAVQAVAAAQKKS
jgi:hypothetical protein